LEWKINAYRVLIRQPEGKRQLERSRYRWKNIIKMDFKEIEYVGMDWGLLTQNRDKR
jgi:hypothetical protein